MDKVELILSGKTEDRWLHMTIDLDNYLEYEDPDIYEKEYL